MKSQTIRRYMLTAQDLLQQLDAESHPDMRSREARKTVNAFDKVVTRIDAALRLPSISKVTGKYHATIGEIEKNLAESCRILGHFALRIQKVPETPIRASLPIMASSVTTLERLIDQAMSCEIVERVAASVDVSDLGIGIDEYLDAEWDKVLATGEFRVPSDIDIMTRPSATMQAIRYMVPPFTAEQKRLIGFSLWEVGNIPDNLAPKANHWMELYTGAMRKWESKLTNGCCCMTVSKTVLLSKTHRASPMIKEGGEYIVFSGETTSCTQEVTLLLSPGQPLMLKATYTLKPDAFRSLIKKWTVWPTAPVENDDSMVTPMVVRQVQDTLNEARETLEAAFGYGDIRTVIGIDAEGVVLFNVEAVRTRNINLPKNDKDAASYLVDVYAEDRRLFGTRSQMEKQARAIGRGVGFRLSDVHEINGRTRTTHTYGMGCWWEVPPDSLSAEACLQAAESFVVKLGWSEDDLDQDDSLRSYLKDRGIPAHENSATTVHDESAKLQSRIRFILDNPALAIPKGSSESLTILLNQLQKGKITNREELITVIPAKLDYIVTHHRKHDPILAFSEENLRKVLSEALPNLQCRIARQMKTAGISAVPLTSREVVDMVTMQAARDLEGYRHSSPVFRIRAAHGDFTSSDRVLGDFHNKGVSTVVRNREGYIEYEIRLNDSVAKSL